MARYLKRRKRGWYFQIDVPQHLRVHFGGTSRIEKTLSTRDENLAYAKAQRMAGEYKLQFMALEGHGPAVQELGTANGTVDVRAAYQGKLDAVLGGTVDADGHPREDPTSLGVDLAIERIVEARGRRYDENGDPVLSEQEEAEVAGLVDGLALRRGQEPKSRERYEQPFRALADRWLEGWEASPDRRPSNTGVQYASSIRLFSEFWGERSIREVTERDAAEFVELLRKLSPKQGRGKLKGVPIREAVAQSGEGGLSPTSIKRHMGVLKQVWAWAKPLGYCSGENPFVIKLPRVKKKPYLGWEASDLKKLFQNPPKRSDVQEAFLVALFTGLRCAEIADLTWSQLREEGGVHYLQVVDAKTEAGYRKVPVHSKLSWLLARERGGDDDPVFPTFSVEGSRESRGGDLSKLFGTWKRAAGITSRRYTFHSTRKNVTEIMERNRIPANEWAKMIGHEVGLTYGTYSPHGLTLKRAQEIIELIDYPDVPLPVPAA